jgi:CubicO group peptidase (beta-lactamase class C family)
MLPLPFTSPCRALLGTALITFALTSCSDAGSPTEAEPELAVGSFTKAADYSALNNGRAVLVMLDGKIVFERYDNGFGADTATHLHSATKGFWGPVIAAMIEDKLITSFDELASTTLPEWKDDPRKRTITLRHLLTLSAGLEQDVANLQGDDRSTLAPDLYAHAIGVRALREPGTVFEYGPVCFYVLGEIMKRKLAARQQTPLDYLKQRILDPIGVRISDWVHDASGNPHIPNGAHLTAREWMKFGQWLLQGGDWYGKQIVRPELLEQLLEPSKTNPGYGLASWLNQPGGQGAAAVPAQQSNVGDKAGWIYRNGSPDMFAALGAGKCRMYLFPSLNMVVLRQGDTEDDPFDDNTFLGLLLNTRTSNDTRH